MAINDLYHVQLFQRVLGRTEPLVTNWFYNGVTLACTAESLANGFQQADGMLESINAIQSHNIQNESLKVLNLFSLTDFIEVNLDGEGAIGGEMLPEYCGISFTKKLDTRGVRPGRVNVMGVPEAVTNINIISDAGYIGFCDALATAMADDINIDVDEIYDPVVIKRIPYTLPATDRLPERTAYRLPTGSGEADFGHITAVLWSAKTSHVITRGNGR